MGTRKHPRTTSHPGLPWFGADRPPDPKQTMLQGGAALLLYVLKQLFSLRWMMMAVVFLSFLSLMVHTLYISGYSLACFISSTAKLARSYSVRLAAPAHEPLSRAARARLSLIHVLPLRQDLIMKALVLVFIMAWPFVIYSILYICVNAIRPYDPPIITTMSGRIDGSESYLQVHLDLSNRIGTAAPFDLADLASWQAVLDNAVEDGASDTKIVYAGGGHVTGPLFYVRELTTSYQVSFCCCVPRASLPCASFHPLTVARVICPAVFTVEEASCGAG